MVIQTNPFTYRQIDIQTVIPQNFRQKFKLLHGKKINPKSEKIDVHTVRQVATH